MSSVTSEIPRQQTALVARGPGQLAIQHDTPVPALAPDMAMVKTAAVAINPADAKMLDFSSTPGAIDGYDFAGTIVALGDDVLRSGRFAVGDRVAGMAFGMNKLKPDVGAFAEYVGACADVLIRIPDQMPFTEAASLGLGIATAGLGLFKYLGVPVSFDQVREGKTVDRKLEDRDFVLVAGGSTATGTRALQLLKIAGLRPIATCSPSNFDLVRRFGAEQVFDYRSPTCAAEIRAYTKNELAYTLDCITLTETTQLCYESLGRAGGRYVGLEPFRQAVADTRPLTVQPSWLMALSIFGTQVALTGEYYRDAQPDDREFGAKLFSTLQAVMDRGLIEPHPIKSMPGGWQGVLKGVDMIRNQSLSGQKLVYAVA